LCAGPAVPGVSSAAPPPLDPMLDEKVNGILVVEDQATVGLMVQNELATMGDENSLATSVKQGLEEARLERAGIALLDIHLLGGDADEIAAELTALGVRVVFMTADPDAAELMSRAPILVKPFAPPDLQEVLAKIDQRDYGKANEAREAMSGRTCG
jgi:DNA-binding response OmpR family regulator